MDKEQQMVEEFSAEAKRDLDTTGAKEGEYCVVLTTARSGPMGGVGTPRRVYKSLDEFKARAAEHIKEIDSMFSVNVQLWMFD